MKVIFLDIDGVLNSDNSLMTDDSLEDALIENLKVIVEKTNAKIILSSSWRLCFPSLYELMNKLDKFNLHLSGMTSNGIRVDWLKAQGITPTNKYFDSFENETGEKIKITFDRGAEIYKWLFDHKDVESFVILDDEDFDIKSYFPNNFIKTQFKTGLTKSDVENAIKILNRR